MVRIVTDTAADYSFHEAKSLGLILTPLSILFEGGAYDQEHDPDFSEFYRRLRSCKQIPSTSQATPQDYIKLFGQAKAAGDEVVAITLSSGLSSTYESGLLARETVGPEGVYVVDSKSAVMGQRLLVDLALRMRDEGKTGREIAEALTSLHDRVRIYGLLDTLENLRKGGRIPPSAALLGTLLNIKPLIIVKDGVIGMAGKARGAAAGLKQMQERMAAGPAIDKRYPVYFGHAQNEAGCAKFRDETMARFGLSDGPMYPIGGVVGTHIGEGAIAIVYVEQA